MTSLSELLSHNIDASSTSVWVFKSSGAASQPKYTGRWIVTSNDLAVALKEAVKGGLAKITETMTYNILAQNNEASALTIGSTEAKADTIVSQVLNESDGTRVKNPKHLSNSSFYVVKFVSRDKALLAVRKTDNAWKSRSSRSWIKAVLAHDILDIERSPVFTIDSKFDFYILNGVIFINSKSNFESVLRYREAHVGAFVSLTQENEFVNVFTEIGPINEYVGSNKMQLRRALAIREKGHYKNPTYMKRLQEECEGLNFNIKFDENGRIIPSLESCAHIFKALLNSRLYSRLSRGLFDVNGAEAV